MSTADVSIATLAPDSGERFQTLRRELGVSSFGINLLVLEPRQRGRVHAHEHQEEVYVVLAGELTLRVDGGKYLLAAEQVARVAPQVRRQLINAGASRLVLLAIGGSGEHSGRDARAWSSWEEQGEGAPPQQVPLPEDLPA